MKSTSNISSAYLFYFFLSAISFLFYSCDGSKQETYTLKPVNLDYTVLASCTVSDPEPYKVKTPAGGDIIKIYAREGDVVEKNQILAQIDDYREHRNLTISKNNLNSVNLQIKDSKESELPRLKEQLSKEKATMSNAEKYLNRLRKLQKAGGIAEVTLEDAEESYKQALSRYNQTEIEIKSFTRSGNLAGLETQRRIISAQIELSEKSLDDKKITAPYRGVITDVFFNEGENIPDNTALLSIIEDKKWDVKANIDQRELPYISISQEAFIVLDAYPSVKISAEVIFVCLDVDISRGSCQIKLMVKDNHDFIKYGMTGNVEIIAKNYTDVLAAPSRFFKRMGGKGYVYIKENNKIVPKEVDFNVVGEKWVILKKIPENSLLYSPTE